ncbi:hypothetical protein FRX31_004671 [Thalictrum thalictroides]|uniref:Uncharacterized protein n=1 Tax=Thalictrum thalictroides TaxID=46969 RepID=A0A7J6X8J8_THATH|nr:hypothetical protein FRX31_004671 [Thalictrum thalictroides]
MGQREVGMFRILARVDLVGRMLCKHFQAKRVALGVAADFQILVRLSLVSTKVLNFPNVVDNSGREENLQQVIIPSVGISHDEFFNLSDIMVMVAMESDFEIGE